jgi:hypothetical protein
MSEVRKCWKHWLFELVGHFSGLSDAQLKQIEKSLPATKTLVDLLNRARPIIEQAQNLYTEAEPLINQAKKEWETPLYPRKRTSTKGIGMPLSAKSRHSALQ